MQEYFYTIIRLSVASNIKSMQNKYFGIFMLIGAISQAVYVVISILFSDYFLALLIGISTVISLILSRRMIRDNYKRPEKYLLIILFFYSSFVIYFTGGLFSEDVYWTFLFPAVVIFMNRDRLSLLAVFTYLFVITTHFFALNISEISGFSIRAFLSYLASYLSLAVLIYLLATAWKASERSLEKQKDEISAANKRLGEYIKKLEYTSSELLQKNQELERVSAESAEIAKTMVHRELKMKELKEELAKSKKEGTN